MTYKPFKPMKAGANFAPPAERATQLPRILYVEDEDLNWELAERELRDHYMLVRARSSTEAFDILAKGTFDLILMDIQLSGSEFNGIEIVRILRNKHGGPLPEYARRKFSSDTPIVFVTAYGSRYGKQELLEAGGDELATKPVNMTSLNLVMSRLIARGVNKKS